MSNLENEKSIQFYERKLEEVSEELRKLDPSASYYAYLKNTLEDRIGLYKAKIRGLQPFYKKNDLRFYTWRQRT
jgi:hypothetical protein